MRKIFLLTSLIFLAFCARSIAQNSKSSPEVPQKFANEAEKKAYYNSLNPTLPEFTTQAEKDAWVKKQQAPKAEKVSKTEVSSAKISNLDGSTSTAATKITANENAKKEASIATEAEKDAYLNKRQKTVYMTQAEFNSLPASKQTAVLADKNFVIIK